MNTAGQTGDKERKRNFVKISYKISTVVTLAIVIFSVILGTFCYLTYKDECIKTHSLTALTIAQTVSTSVDGEVFFEIMKSGQKTDKWFAAKELLDKTITLSEAKHIYIIAPEINGKYRLYASGLSDIELGCALNEKHFSGEVDKVFKTGIGVSKTYDSGENSAARYDRFISGFSPVFDSDRNVIGVVGVDISADKVLKDVNAFGVEMLLGVICLTTIIAFFISWYAKHLLGDPISELSKASENLAAGNINISKLPNQNDEIGLLAENIYKVAQSINILTTNINSFTKYAGPANFETLINIDDLTGKYLTVAQGINKAMTIIENIDALVYVRDLETYELLFVNRKTKNMSHQFGFPPNELLGKKCWQVLQRKMDGPCSFCVIPKLLPNKDDLPVYEWEHYNECTKTWFLVKDAIIRWYDGKLVHFATAADITQRKQSEEKLKLQEQALREAVLTAEEASKMKSTFLESIRYEMDKAMAIIDNADKFVYVRDLETYELLFVNRGLANALEVNTDEIIGKKCWQVLQPNKTEPCSFCPVLKILPDKENSPTYYWEHYNEPLNAWLSIKDSIIRWIDGRLVHLAIGNDMTQQKQTAEKLQNLAAIVATADAGLVVRDREGVILEWSIGAQNILGYTPEEMVGKTTKDYAPPAAHAGIDEMNERLLQGEHTVHTDVMRNHKDGRIIYCSASYTPILDDTGNVTGSVTIFHDTTEKNIANNKAQSLAAIISTADAGFIVKDREGVLLEWNVGAQDIFGYSREEMLGKTTKDYTPDEKHAEIDDMNQRLLKGEHIAHVEVVRKHKDGRLIDCSASYTPILDAEGNVTGSVAIFHDISEKKQIEKEHKILENTLANLFENLVNGFVLYELAEMEDGSENLKVVMANKAFWEYSDKPADALSSAGLVGKLFTEVSSAGMEHISYYISVAKTGGGRTYESYNYGLKQYINEVVFSPAPGQIALILTDRTPIVEAEEALREQEKDLALLFSSMTSGFCLGKIIRNEQGEAIDISFEMTNCAFETLENFEVGTVHGKKLSELRSIENSAYFSTYVDVATNRNKINFRKYISSQNTTLDVVCYSPNTDYFVCIENDISEQVWAEEELHKAYMDTEAILAEIPAPICVVARDNGLILGCNTAFAKICCSNNETELFGTSIWMYLKHINGSDDAVVTLLQQGVNFKCNLKRLDGSNIEVEVFSSQFVYKEQDAYALYCMDLTQQMLQEQALREVAVAAEEASKMKSAFLANMSHEIRTPLNGIIGFTELALDDDNLSDKTANYLSKIKISALSLLGIINDILDISKIEAGKVDLEKIPFHLGDVFENCETLSIPKALEKNICLFFNLEPLASKKIIGDPTKLQQILLNLLANAIKFTNSGFVKLTSSVKKVTGNNMTIDFEVKDSGIGMTSEQIEKIFKPFTQADSSTTRKYGGTGLGLSITKNIIDLMGGELKVESIPDIGSRFSFTLNFETTDIPVENFDVSYSSIKENKYEKPIFKGDVLICEDNAINQQVIEEHLSRIGLNATIAENGEQGVAIANKRMLEGKPFDIILMDIHMPVMDGLEAMQKLNEIGNKSPVIAMTANAMSQDKEKFLKYGMSDYIGKPFIVQELWSRLLKYLTPLNIQLIEETFEAGTANDIFDADIAAIKDAGTKNTIINKALGIKMVGGSEELYQKVLMNFLKTNKTSFVEITDAISSGNIKQAHRVAHTLKGVAGLIGAVKLKKAAQDVEESLSSGKIDFSQCQMQLLESSLNEVLDKLSSLTENSKPISNTQTGLDKEHALQLIEKLEKLLVAANAESLEFLDEVSQILSPAGEQTKILVEQMEDYEFELALETLKNIKQLVSGVK